MTQINCVFTLLICLSATLPAHAARRTSIPIQRLSPVQGEISSSLNRGFDEYADYFTTLGASLSYRMTNTLIFRGEAEYQHTFTEYEERHTDSMEDTVFSISSPTVYRHYESGFNMDGGVKLRLPTSKVSRRTGLRFASGAGLNLSFPIGRAKLIQSNSYTYYNQQYDTADVAGLEPNPIHGVGVGLGLSLQLTHWLTWSVGGHLHTLWDLEGDRDQIEIFASSLELQIDQIWSFSMGIQSTNKILSNNSLFDEDTTVLSIGLAAKI